LPGFYNSVLEYLNAIEQYGIKEVIGTLIVKKEPV
jgi:hypothetical protein